MIVTDTEIVTIIVTDPGIVTDTGRVTVIVTDTGIVTDTRRVTVIHSYSNRHWDSNSHTLR